MISRPILFAVIAVVVLGAWASADAATIHGQLVNGTTGLPVDGTIRVVNPSGGMAQEQEIQAVGGEFTIEGLDANAPIYLLRADHAGVTYSEVVRLAGQETGQAKLTVYGSTTSWDNAHVLVPHLAVAASDGHLQIEVAYEVHNHGDPETTIAGEDAQLEIYIPEDRIEIIRAFVSYHEVPLDWTPVPTDRPGIYRVDYPMRPGDTTINIAYSVPYPDNTYSLSYTVPRAIQEMTIYAINANMGVASNNLELGAASSVHGMTAFAVSDISAGSTFDLTFKGGDPIDASTPASGSNPHAGGGSPTVFTLPTQVESPSVILMAGILLLLAVVLGVTLRGAVSPLDRPDQVKQHYDRLLKRLAKLDDLHATEAVTPEVYSVKRTELKTQLATLMYRMQAGKGGTPERAGRSAQPVAGNERTAS